jgi:hypothetical protein
VISPSEDMENSPRDELGATVMEKVSASPSSSDA